MLTVAIILATVVTLAETYSEFRAAGDTASNRDRTVEVKISCCKGVPTITTYGAAAGLAEWTIRS